MRSTSEFGWWLATAAGVVIAAALFAAGREKPVVIFAVGFGALLGLALRLAAQSLNVAGDRRLPWLAGLIVAGGFLLSFVPSYRRAALEWNRALSEQPTDPIAAAVLKQMEQSSATPAVQPYSIGQYLARRVPGVSSPWPAAIFGAEWMGCGLLAAVCVAWKGRGPGNLEPPSPEEHRP